MGASVAVASSFSSAGVIHFKPVVRQRQAVQRQRVRIAVSKGESVPEQLVYAGEGVYFIASQGAAVKEQSALAGAPLVFRQRRGGVLAGHGRGAGEDDERQFRVVGIPGALEGGLEALVGAHHHLRLFDAGGGQKRLHAGVEHGQPVPGRAAHRPVDHRQQPRHAGHAFQRPENAAAVHRLQSV